MSSSIDPTNRGRSRRPPCRPGRVEVFRRTLAFFEKLPPCLVGMEACGTARGWSDQSMMTSFIAMNVTQVGKTQNLRSVLGRRFNPRIALEAIMNDEQKKNLALKFL